MTNEEKIQHANNLKDFPSWNVFIQDMKDLKELKSNEMNVAYLNDRAQAGAFVAGFKLALETVIEYPERTIKKNMGFIKRMQSLLDRENEKESSNA